MSPVVESTPSQRVPAWKRLGLQLKQSPAGESTSGSLDVGHRSHAQQVKQSSKRKLDHPGSTDASPRAKQPRTDHQEPPPKNSAKKPKKAKLGDADTADDVRPTKPGREATAAQKQKIQSRSIKGKGIAREETASPADLGPALAYLRLWKTSIDAWKFNKNLQSALIKHVFDSSKFPTSDICIFYEYIRNVKGFVRMRLREAAMDIRMTDDAAGASAFPPDTEDVSAQQAQYESSLQDLLRSQRLAGNRRKRFNEADFLSSSEDADVVIQRVVKRMRAEMVIDELSEDSETESSTAAQGSTATLPDAGAMTVAEKRIKMNDGKRRRKLRTNLDDNRSSSESEPESDSDTSSSGSSGSSGGSSTSGGGGGSSSESETASQADDGDESSSSSSSSSDDESDDSDIESEAGS